MPPITVDEIIERLNALFDKIQDKLNWITDRINSLLSHVPGWAGWVVDKFMDAWNAMLGKLQEFWDWFTDKLAYVGDPFTLWSTSDLWHTVVGEPGKVLADSIEDSDLLVDNTWTGPAAESYKGQVPDQETALRTLGQSFATTASSQLKTLSVGIGIFWLGVIAAVAALAWTIVAAAGETGSVIGIPAVPATIAAGLVTCLLALGAALGSLVGALKISADGFRSVVRYATDWPEFAVQQ